MKLASSDQRIEVLDVNRGLASLGILLINITFYSTSLQAIQWQIVLWPDALNQAVRTFLNLFVDGKCLAVFCFLFGYSTILLRDRTIQKGLRFGPLYIRRLVALLVFSLIHGLFIWYGDILLHYALLGFILLFFHSRQPKTLLIWAIALLSTLPVLLLLSGGGAQPQPDPEIQGRIHELIARDNAIYSRGTYADIQALRTMDWAASAMNQLLFYPQILGMFMLGAYFAKQRILHDVAANGSLLKKLAIWTGGIGLLLTFLPPTLSWASGAETGLVNSLQVVQYLIGASTLGLFYITAVALLVRHQAWQTALRPLAYVGRMAFTNYIMQSVICTLIFYGYGLGWYGKVGPLAGTLIALGVFGVQMLFSGVWLRFFRIGPLEWLWRAVTYLTIPPLRR